ncbi:5960_t:CDS:2, partial [Scutellospora calospora]
SRIESMKLFSETIQQEIFANYLYFSKEQYKSLDEYWINKGNIRLM